MQTVGIRQQLHHAAALRRNGFTLLELALTLAILGALAAGVLVPFVAQVAQRNIASTERILEQAREVLLGFATVNGRLPCPATDTSNGIESPAVPAIDGECTSFYGFLPAATLGFTPIDSQGYGIDGWGSSRNRIRYAVSDSGGANTFTRPGGTPGSMKAVGPAALASPTLIYVCASAAGVNTAAPSCGTAVMLTDRAPAVIWSLGAETASRGADEAQNQFPGPMSGGATDRIFVSHTMSAAASNEFDDIVSWLSVGNLVSRMVLGGQLP